MNVALFFRSIALWGWIVAWVFMLGCGETETHSTKVAPPFSSKVNVEVLAKSTKSWNQKTLPMYPAGKSPEVSILKITIPPKTVLKKHWHTCINAGILLKGELWAISEDRDTLRMREGDPIIEMVNAVHYGYNPLDVPAEIVVVYAGVKDSAVTISVAP